MLKPIHACRTNYSTIIIKTQLTNSPTNRLNHNLNTNKSINKISYKTCNNKPCIIQTNKQ